MTTATHLPHTLVASLSGFAFILGVATSALGQVQDKYKVTSAEKAACTVDAVRLCSWTYPDEEQLLGCMKTNRASLSSTCRVAFDAGVKRRHL